MASRVIHQGGVDAQRREPMNGAGVADPGEQCRLAVGRRGGSGGCQQGAAEQPGTEQGGGQGKHSRSQ